MIIYGKVAGSAETLNLDTNICSEMGTEQELSESVHAGYIVRITKREREVGHSALLIMCTMQAEIFC